MGDILHYYAGNHTAKGFYSLYASNFQELDHVLFLEGESVSMKTRLMNELIKTCSEKEYDLEIIHSYDENYLDGFVLPQWKVGVYGGLSHVFQGNHASVKK
mgnify:FL=1